MNYAVNEVPVDLDKYIESVRQAGLDPKQLLAASGFNRSDPGAWHVGEGRLGTGGLGLGWVGRDVVTGS